MLNNFVFYKYYFFWDLLNRTTVVLKPVLTFPSIEAALCIAHTMPWEFQGFSGWCGSAHYHRATLCKQQMQLSVSLSGGSSPPSQQGLHMCAQITTSKNTGRGLLADFWNFLWIATCSTLYCLINLNDLHLPELSGLFSGSSRVFLSQCHLEILLRHYVSEAVVGLNVFPTSRGSFFFIVKCPISWAAEMRKCSELWEMGNKLRPEFVTHSTWIKRPSMVSCACHSSIEGQGQANL